MEPPTTKTLPTNDHDLLVVVHTKMERVQSDIREIKDNLAGRVSVLELQKLDKTDAEKILQNALMTAAKTHDGLEARLSAVEKGADIMGKKIDVFIARVTTWGLSLMFLLGLAEFLINKFL